VKIAIVDDSTSVRMMIKICLDDLGVQDDHIYEFSSAIEALNDFQNNNYDLVFCDLHMPEMNGDELVEKISASMQHIKMADIVIVSGEEGSEYKHVFKKFGVDKFIKKPIKTPSFIHHIKPLIDKINIRNK